MRAWACACVYIMPWTCTYRSKKSMSERSPDTLELLASPRGMQRRRRRHKNDALTAGYLSEGGTAAIEQTDFQSNEDTHSYLSDQGLPSERARLAASNRYRELQRSGCEEQKSNDERTPLLASQTKESALDDSRGTGEPVPLGFNATKAAAINPKSCEPAPRASVRSRTGIGVKKGEQFKQKLKKLYRFGPTLRVVVLTTILTVSIILFSLHKDLDTHLQIVNIASDTSILTYNDTRDWDHAALSISGPLIDEPYRSTQACEWFLFFCEGNGTTRCSCQCNGSSACQSVRISNSTEPTFPSSNIITKNIPNSNSRSNFCVEFFSYGNVSFEVSARGELISNELQVVIATIILGGVYFLITFDLVHRTLAAFIGSTVTIATLSMLNKRPTLDTVVEWIDLDTMFLLFGMMTLVTIFSQTGFFDYAAVKAYKIARGKITPLIIILCLLSAVVSAFLDNVTTILLLTPVSIRLSQVLNVDPRPVLIAEVVFSNIGGTATAVGDPPNVIIIANDIIQSRNIDFAEFTLHLFLGILVCMVVAYGVLALLFRTCIRLHNTDSPHIAEMKREIAIWERTASQMPIVSLEEAAVRDALRAKAKEVRNQLHHEEVMSVRSAQDMWQENLAELEQQYRITDLPLLLKSSAVLMVVILLFFLANVFPGIELDLGWIAVFGAVVLLVLSDIQDLDPVLHKIEWATLLFFAGLFVLMEGLQELGLIEFIGNVMVDIIKTVPLQHQMLVAIILVVWISALSSSFIDNIPFTTATIPVIVELAESPEVCLSLRPLVWALAFGACLGGNGTLIGASANVVCAGIAEQNGCKISFFKFFIIGFPMMLATTFTAMVYLLICHVAFDWNIDSSCNT